MFDTLYAVLDRATVFDGARQVSYARLRGSRVLQAGVCPIDELAGRVGSTLRVALISPLNYGQRMSLDVFRRSLVPFVARRQLEQDAVFSDRFRLRTEVLSLRDGKAEAYVVACLEDDAEMAMESLPVQRCPLTRLALAESAVAALVGRVTREPVLVLWYRAGLLTCLGVTGSRVVWQRAQRVDEAQFAGRSQWRTQVERAAMAAPAEFAGALALRLNLGDGPWRAEGAWADNGSKKIADDISKIFKDIPSDAVLAAPELYGLAFVPRQANLVMNGYGQRVRAWQWGRPTAALAACAGLALGAAGLLASANADREGAAAQAEAALLTSRYAAVQAALPSKVAIDELQKVLAINDVIMGSVRVDHLLAQLAKMVPPRVQLKRIEIGRLKPGAASAGSAKGIVQKDFFVELDFALKGSYAESRRTAEIMVARLAELGSLVDTRMNHVDDQIKKTGPAATFSTRILLNGKALP